MSDDRSAPHGAPRVIVAVALALLILAAPPLLASALVTPEDLDGGALAFVPDCPSRLAGETCALCGMSHAFAAMSAGRVEDARGYNPNGPWLFALTCAAAGLGAVGLGGGLVWRRAQ